MPVIGLAGHGLVRTRKIYVSRQGYADGGRTYHGAPVVSVTAYSFDGEVVCDERRVFPEFVYRYVRDTVSLDHYKRVEARMVRGLDLGEPSLASVLLPDPPVHPLAPRLAKRLHAALSLPFERRVPRRR